MVSEHIKEMEIELWKMFNTYFPKTNVSTDAELNLRSKALVILMMSKELGVQGHADNIKSKETQQFRLKMEFKNILELKEGCDKKLPVKQRRVRDRLHCCKFQLCKECKLKIKTLEGVIKEIRSRQWIGTHADEEIIRIINGEPKRGHYTSGN